MSDVQLLQSWELVKSFLAAQARCERHTHEESQAWDSFFELHDPAIRIALRKCGTSQTNPDDLTQQVWLVLTRRLASFANDPSLGTVSAYKNAITRHAAGRHRRHVSNRHSMRLSAKLVATLLDH